MAPAWCRDKSRGAETGIKEELARRAAASGERLAWAEGFFPGGRARDLRSLPSPQYSPPHALNGLERRERDHFSAKKRLR